MSRRIGLVIGVGSLLIGTLVLARYGGLRSLALGWFGPPQVELGETWSETDGEGVFDHSSFDSLVAANVDADGYVDYEGLAERADELDAYIETLAAAPFDSLGRDERLALLINGYNAFTLRLILDYYPIDSIKDIPTAERWDAVRWQLAGETYSLNQIEHELVRPNFREPRIHFALVCAAVGCPPLRAEAYTGDHVEEQLESQTAYAHDGERWLRYSAGADTVELTSLYEWYGGDFEQVADSIVAYAARYDEDLAADLAAGRVPAVRFLDYDWALNEQ